MMKTVFFAICIAIFFLPIRMACSQIIVGSQTDGDLAMEYAMSFVDLEDKLPDRYGYDIVLEGLVPQIASANTDIVVWEYDGAFDIKKKASFRGMRKSFYSVGEDFPYSREKHDRLMIKDQLFEKFERVDGFRESTWCKVKGFTNTEMVQDAQPWCFAIMNPEMMSGNGPSGNTFARYISESTLIAVETNERGIKGTWMTKPVSSIVWKMAVFFDKENGHSPTFSRFTLHDKQLKGEDLLKDKGKLSAETRAIWKKFGAIRLPVSIESTMSRNMVPEHSQMWKAKIDWYFGDDVHEVFTLPSEFVDMEKILAANKGETP